MTLKPVAAFLGSAALAFAASAHAQGAQRAYPQPPQGPYNHGPGQAQGPNEQADGPDLSGLHDALRLAPDQERDWRAYVAAITPDPSAEQRHRQAAMMMATLPTPRRIDLITAEMEDDMAAMRRQGEAVKSFYNRLTPIQQRAFDARTAPQAGEPDGPPRR